MTTRPDAGMGELSKQELVWIRQQERRAASKADGPRSKYIRHAGAREKARRLKRAAP